MVFYKSKSLLPGILAHALVDVLSKFGADSENMAAAWVYMGATIVVAIVYCMYLTIAANKAEIV